MGAHPRAVNPLSYEQMVQYESNRIKWFSYCGHVTNMKELADIFGVPHTTVLTRVKAGWSIEAALLADTKTQWTIRNIHFFEQYQMDTSVIYETLDKHFSPKVTGKRKSNKGGK